MGQVAAVEEDCAGLAALASAAGDTAALSRLVDYADEASESALRCATRAAHHGLAASRSIASLRHEREFLAILAYNFVNLSEFDSARHYNEARARVARELGDSVELADVSFLAGAVASFEADYDGGIEHYRTAADLFGALGDRRGVGRTYEMMARLSVTRNAHEEGVAFAEEALRLGRQLSDTSLLILALGTLADALLESGRHREALRYSQEERALARLLDDDIDLAEALLGATGLYTALGELAQAEIYLAEALDIQGAVYGERYPDGAGLLERATLLGAQGRYAQQAAALRQLMAQRSASDYDIDDDEHLELIIAAYDSLGRYDSAYHYARLLLVAKDSIYQRDASAALSDLRVQYQTAERERDLAEQGAVLAVERRNRYLSLGLAALGFLAAGIVGYLALQLRRRNREREALVHEVHHRVKNNLQVVSSLLYLQRRHVEDPAAVAAIRESQHRVEAMGLIHQRLYTRDRLTSVRMDSYLAELTEALQEAFGGHRTTVTLEVEPVELPVQVAIELGLIANELISNSFKYAGAGGRLWVRLGGLEGGRYRFEVADDGGGEAGNGDRGEGPAVATAQGTGFGTQLVEMLSQKLATAPEVRRGPEGYATAFEFSAENVG